MSAGIVEAVKTLGREKGISEEKLMGALEDALLSAYKKQPGSARYARVIMDHESGDFPVEQLILPADLGGGRVCRPGELGAQPLGGAEEAATVDETGGRRVDPETGEVVVPEAPEIP